MGAAGNADELQMMDDATLHDLIQSEQEHFDALEQRRKRAALFNESRDVLAHYDRLESRSLAVLTTLISEKYRRECEQCEQKKPPARQR